METEWIDGVTLFGGRLIDCTDFVKLLLRFILNGGVLLLLVYKIYLTHSTRRNYAFSFLAVGAIVFLLCFLLSGVKLELGFALGLFAIFGIIRYRTDVIPFKQMTYLFVVIGISVINALSCDRVSVVELLFANGVTLGGVWLMELYLSRRHEGSMSIVYENIYNVNYYRYEQLLNDLQSRTGFKITHFEIESIDYLKDVAVITIYYNATDNSHYAIEEDAEL